MIRGKIIIASVLLLLSCVSSPKQIRNDDTTDHESNASEAARTQEIENFGNFREIIVSDFSEWQNLQIFPGGPIGWYTTENSMNLFYSDETLRLPPKDHNFWHLISADRFILYVGFGGSSVIVYDTETNSTKDFIVGSHINMILGESTIFGFSYDWQTMTCSLYHIEPESGIYLIGSFPIRRGFGTDQIQFINEDMYFVSNGVFYKATTTDLKALLDYDNSIAIDGDWENHYLLADFNGDNPTFILSEALNWWKITDNGSNANIVLVTESAPLLNTSPIKLLMTQTEVLYLGYGGIQRLDQLTGQVTNQIELPKSIETEPYSEKPNNLAFDFLLIDDSEILVAASKTLVLANLMTNETMELQIFDNSDEDYLLGLDTFDNGIAVVSSKKSIYQLFE